MKDLKDIRKRIDIIDDQVLGLLNKRAKEVLKITTLKEKQQCRIFHPEREADIIARLKNHNSGPFSQEDIQIIFTEIFSLCRSLQKTSKVAYLGPEGTFSHLATIKQFGKKAQYVQADSISKVFDNVEKGLVDYGVVPIENSIEGGVTYTLDMFCNSPLKVSAEIRIAISHCLLARKDVKGIKTIYSHSQVLSQCRKWLMKNLPNVELIPTDSTAQAALNAKNDNYSACIGNKALANMYGLVVRAQAIEDMPYNITRFFVISKEENDISGNDKTSVLFSIKDKVGALYDVLQCFKKYKINLTRIESRPSKIKPWEYYFFVDFKGHIHTPLIKKALEELENNCLFLKILGSYPQAN